MTHINEMKPLAEGKNRVYAFLKTVDSHDSFWSDMLC